MLPRLPLLLALTLLAATLARADDAPFVPAGLPHQGRLLGTDDQPVDGRVQMTFALYHQAAGGTAAWTETRSVPVEKGFYSLILGDPSAQGTSPLSSDLLASPTWLGVTIANGVEMTPRLQVGTVPYAWRAELANRMRGGTIEGATITGSSIDATEIKVGGVTVIDDQGRLATLSQQLLAEHADAYNAQNLGGRAAADYVTTDKLRQDFATKADLAVQEYENRLRNSSFELGAASALPTSWAAVGAGQGDRVKDTDAQFGSSSLKLADRDNAGQVAVEQVFIPGSAIQGHVGETFTASVYAKKVAGAVGSKGRLCLVEAASGAQAMDCVSLTTDATWASAAVQHTISANAAYLSVVLDSGTDAGDANNYLFDGAMVSRGFLAPPWVANTSEALYDGSIASTKLIMGAGSGLDADKLDGIDSTGFVRGNYVAGNASGNVPVSNGTLNANLNAEKLNGLASVDYLQLANAQTVTGAKTFTAGPVFSAATPFVIANAAAGKVANLDADKLDGLTSADYLQLANAQTITGAKAFTAGPVFAAATPFTISNVGAAKVANLDADKLDGLDSAAFLQLSGSQSITGTPTFGNGAVVTSGKNLMFGTSGENTDSIYLVRSNPGTDASTLRVVVGDNPTGGDAFEIGTTDGTTNFDLDSNGSLTLSRGTLTAAAIHATGGITEDCTTGWASANRGRLCVSGLQTATNFYAAQDACRAKPGSGLVAHVCTYTDLQTACAAGAITASGATTGWYGDMGNADDYFQTWNTNSCVSNNTGSPTVYTTALPYRCCY